MKNNQGFKAPNSKMVSGTQVLNGAGLLIASKAKPWSERRTLPGMVATTLALRQYNEDRKAAIAEVRARIPHIDRPIPAILRDR